MIGVIYRKGLHTNSSWTLFLATDSGAATLSEVDERTISGIYWS